MKLSKLNKFFKSNIFYIIVAIILLILLLVLYHQYKKSVIIPENKKSLKFELQSSLFDNNQGIDLLFEPEDLDYYKETFVPLPEQIFFQEETAEAPARVEVPEVDRQNVHESFVNKYIRKIYDNCTKIKYTSNVIDEIKYVAGDNERINMVLNELNKRNANITNLGDTSELDVLSSIWHKAKSNDNIKDMFLIQLSDSINEHGDIVCPTGVVNRLSTALIVDTPESFPKTKAMVNDEILQTASNLRTELEKNVYYNELNEESQNTEFKAKLMDKITSDYQGIIDVPELQEIIEPWIDSI